MTTQPQPEALRQRLLDHAACHESEHTLMAEDEQRQWASDLREAESLIGRLHAECEELRMERGALRAATGGRMGYFDDEVGKLRAECEALRADRDSWERQCSDRVDDAVEFLQQRDEARAECEALRATQSDTLLRLLCDLRFALGDNGARMQHDLVEYARGMRADAERWREFRTFVVGKSTPGFLNGKPAAYMVLPAITVPRVGMTLDESIDAARAAKEQQG